MSHLRSRLCRPSPATIVAVVAVVLAMSGTGYAALGGNAGKAGQRFFSTDRWLPGGSEVHYAGIFIGSRICTQSPPGGGSFAIPLELPDGASITKVTFYYFDFDPNNSLEFTLGAHMP